MKVLNLYAGIGGNRKKWKEVSVTAVKPYYKTLIEPDAVLQRHLFWSNFSIPPAGFLSEIKIRIAQIPDLEKALGFSLAGFKIKNKRQILRNCVDPELGLHILESTRGAARRRSLRVRR